MTGCTCTRTDTGGWCPAHDRWNETDWYRPAAPPSFVQVTECDHDTLKLALSVHCPSCTARAHRPCTRWTSRTTGIAGYHQTRMSKARDKIRK
jgi:hypothetical protein